MLCNKIDYRIVHNVMTFIITLPKRRQNFDVFTLKK